MTFQQAQLITKRLHIDSFTFSFCGRTFATSSNRDGQFFFSELIHLVVVTIVMLDGVEAFRSVDDPGAEIHWGAYLGTPLEITVSGRLGEVAETISDLRGRARQEHGWIMDTYLIRRTPGQAGEGEA